jgi:hypothetical protein
MTRRPRVIDRLEAPGVIDRWIDEFGLPGKDLLHISRSTAYGVSRWDVMFDRPSRVTWHRRKLEFVWLAARGRHDWPEDVHESSARGRRQGRAVRRSWMGEPRVERLTRTAADSAQRPGPPARVAHREELRDGEAATHP